MSILSQIGRAASIGKSAALGYAAKAAVGTAKGTIKAGAYAGKYGAKGIGAAAVGVASAGAAVGGAVGKSLLSNNRALNPVGSYAQKFVKFGGSLIKNVPTKTTYNEATGEAVTRIGGYRLNKKGLAVIGGLGMAGSAADGAKSMENKRLGQIASQMVTATPNQASYLNNGGATGDLVFALNAQRRKM